MIVRKALAVLAATSLALGSTVAAAAPAPAETARVESPVQDAENIRGWFWWILILGGIVAAVFLLTKNDDPVSP